MTDEQEEEEAPSKHTKVRKRLTLMDELKELLKTRRELKRKEEGGPPRKSKQTESFGNLMNEYRDTYGSTRPSPPETLAGELHKEVDKRKQRPHLRTRGDFTTPATGVQCKLHQRRVVYDNEQLLWVHGDDSSSCEEMDKLPHPQGNLSENIINLSLRAMLRRVIHRSHVQGLVNTWLEEFQSNQSLTMLAEKWSLVLMAAALTDELKIDYEPVGGKIRKLMRDFSNKMLLISALDLIRENELDLPAASDMPLLRTVEAILESLRGRAQIVGSSVPYGLLLKELKQSKAFQARRPKSIIRKKWVSEFLADVKRDYQLGLLDYDTLLKEVIDDDPVLVRLLEVAKDIVGFEDITKTHDGSMKQDTLHCIFRRLMQMDDDSSLENQLGYIGVIGIAIERDVSKETGFSYDLLTLKNYSIARKLSSDVQRLFPALSYLRFRLLEEQEAGAI